MKKFKLYSCLGLMFISVLVPLRVLAYDESFYSSNDILFYNPDDTGIIDSSDSNSPGVIGPNNPGEEFTFDCTVSLTDYPSLRGSDWLGKAFYYYRDVKKLSGAQAAGVVGNLRQESGGNPCAINTDPINGGAFGIAQWLSTGRVAGLKTLAASRGKSIDDFQVQLDYLWQELTTTQTDVYNNLTNDNPVNACCDKYGEALFPNGLSSLTRPEIYAVIFERFERAGEEPATILAVRGKFANQAFSLYGSN